MNYFDILQRTDWKSCISSANTSEFPEFVIAVPELTVGGTVVVSFSLTLVVLSPKREFSRFGGITGLFGGIGGGTPLPNCGIIDFFNVVCVIGMAFFAFCCWLVDWGIVVADDGGNGWFVVFGNFRAVT